MLTNDQKQAIQGFAQGKPIEVLYLFGSQTTNTARPDSDYDFGVVYKNDIDNTERFALDAKLTMFLEDALKKEKVDVVDLKRAYLRFRYEAIKARNDVYVADNQIRDDFEHEVLQNYFDEMYYMKQTTRDYLKMYANS